jgi:hypothetical protein
MDKEVSVENAQLYDFISHEYGYKIEYIKELDMQSIINLVRAAIIRQKKDLVQLCNLIRLGVYGNKEVTVDDAVEENEEDNLRKLIKDLTKATDVQIDECKDKGISVPI